MAWRIIAGILLFISVFCMPFWVTVLYGIFCLYVFDSFYEVIAAFALVDFLYGAHEMRFHGFALVGLALGLAFFFGMQLFKKSLRR